MESIEGAPVSRGPVSKEPISRGPVSRSPFPVPFAAASKHGQLSSLHRSSSFF